MASNELLSIEGLNAWYGESHILHGVDLHVKEGEVVCLLGRNGAGRTTTMRAIMGLVGKRTGSIRIRTKGSGSVEVSRVGGDFVVDRKGTGSIEYREVRGRVSVPDRERRRWRRL